MIATNGKGNAQETLTYLGCDPGFSANKFACVRSGEMVTYLLPASVGEANRRLQNGLFLPGVVRATQRTSRQPFRVVFDGIEYLVGPNVSDYTEPIDRLDFNRFKDSPELRATFYAGISRIINSGAHRAAIALALPVKVLAQEAEAEQVEKAIKGWLVGRHLFSVDGVECALEVVSVRARVPQPVATWFDWGMDLSGQWVRGKQSQLAPTLVIDQGFNTLDVLLVSGGRISQRFTEGDTLGMRRAAERLIRSIKHKYGPELELHQASDLVQQVVNGQKAGIYVEGQLTDITVEARQALKALESEVFNYLDRMIKSKESYHILLTGGGALAMREMLLRQFPKATVMPEPVLANARGLAKLAARPGFFNK
ncbi:MAG: ParM/StbA family protein [Anaerolineales bacterium]|nr:ParM/StbA family protein [Anaerolineales bacterium]